MTFDSRLFEEVLDTLGCDDTLRRAYRVYLWRRALGLVHHSRSNEGATTGGSDLRSVIQRPLPSSDRWSGLDSMRCTSAVLELRTRQRVSPISVC